MTKNPRESTPDEPAAKRQRTEMHPPPPAISTLVESTNFLERVSTHLADTGALGTLASLLRTSTRAYKVAGPILYRRIVICGTNNFRKLMAGIPLGEDTDPDDYYDTDSDVGFYNRRSNAGSNTDSDDSDADDGFLADPNLPAIRPTMDGDSEPSELHSRWPDKFSTCRKLKLFAKTVTLIVEDVPDAQLTRRICSGLGLHYPTRVWASMDSHEYDFRNRNAPTIGRIHRMLRRGEEDRVTKWPKLWPSVRNLRLSDRAIDQFAQAEVDQPCIQEDNHAHPLMSLLVREAQKVHYLCVDMPDYDIPSTKHIRAIQNIMWLSAACFMPWTIYTCCLHNICPSVDLPAIRAYTLRVFFDPNIRGATAARMADACESLLYEKRRRPDKIELIHVPDQRKRNRLNYPPDDVYARNVPVVVPKWKEVVPCNVCNVGTAKYV